MSSKALISPAVCPSSDHPTHHWSLGRQLFALTCLAALLSGCSQSSTDARTFSPSDLKSAQEQQLKSPGEAAKLSTGDDKQPKKIAPTPIPAEKQSATSETTSVSKSLAETSETKTPSEKTVASPEKVPPPTRPVPGEIATASGLKLDNSASLAPREIKLLVPFKDFRKDPKDRSIRLSFDDIDLLKVLNMEPVPSDPVSHFPEWLKLLDGQKIRLRGFMVPTELLDDIRYFVLARDNQICCFGRNPKVYDILPVKLASGITTNYIHYTESFDVVGTFHIAPEIEEGHLVQLYSIDNAKIVRH